MFGLVQPEIKERELSLFDQFPPDSRPANRLQEQTLVSCGFESRHDDESNERHCGELTSKCSGSHQDVSLQGLQDVQSFINSTLREETFQARFEFDLADVDWRKRKMKNFAHANRNVVKV